MDHPVISLDDVGIIESYCPISGSKKLTLISNADLLKKNPCHKSSYLNIGINWWAFIHKVPLYVILHWHTLRIRYASPKEMWLANLLGQALKYKVVHWSLSPNKEHWIDESKKRLCHKDAHAKLVLHWMRSRMCAEFETLTYKVAKYNITGVSYSKLRLL